MKALQVACIVGAIALTGIYLAAGNTPVATAPDAAPEPAVPAAMPQAAVKSAMPEAVVKSAMPEAVVKSVMPLLAAAVPQQASAGAETALAGPGLVTGSLSGPLMARAEIAALPMKLAALNGGDVAAPPPAARNASFDITRDALGPASSAQDFRYLIYYVWSELPPAEKPAQVVVNSWKDIPLGTPVEEIRRASDAFGLDFNFMKAVAKIESNFDPNKRTGSYIGVFQLSEYEFGKFGSGQIRNPRDNAVAAAYKVITEGILFEWITRRKPDLSDLYLIHQQGWEGAAEHISRPDRLAWKSMCATREGREKGEKWCKRAIWGNTLPVLKKEWKSVDNVTSAAFVGMWRARVAEFRTKYMAAADGAKP